MKARGFGGFAHGVHMRVFQGFEHGVSVFGFSGLYSIIVISYLLQFQAGTVCLLVLYCMHYWYR